MAPSPLGKLRFKLPSISIRKVAFSFRWFCVWNVDFAREHGCSWLCILHCRLNSCRSCERAFLLSGTDRTEEDVDTPIATGHDEVPWNGGHALYSIAHALLLSPQASLRSHVHVGSLFFSPLPCMEESHAIIQTSSSSFPSSCMYALVCVFLGVHISFSLRTIRRVRAFVAPPRSCTHLLHFTLPHETLVHDVLGTGGVHLSSCP